ncbi:MAG: thymidylate kinase [Clostridioides sp.]|jgi:dTMP kinase|nr:thymidylate kinase [Clostridioides sp.]
MKGKLIIIESGTDASGKETQSEKLYTRLKAEGYKIKKVQYPNYDSESSALVKMYLRGDMGKDAECVDPYIASTFFAVDRYASFKIEWEKFYNEGGIIIADRYTTSNMVHQASKMDKDDREKYLDWLDDYEYNMYGLPRPDAVIFLDVPVDVSERLMADRDKYTGGEEKKDIHESDREYLRKCYDNSLDIASKYGWSMVDCAPDGLLRSIESIHEEIYGIAIKTVGQGCK